MEEKHDKLVNDPRIMVPLAEFLRTVREVVGLTILGSREAQDYYSDSVLLKERLKV